MYGYTDSNEVTSTQGGVFGLNKGATIVRFGYNPNGGTAGAAGDSIDLAIKVGDREYLKRYFPVTRAYGKDGQEITDTTSEDYKKGIETETKLLNATLCDIVECFVPKDALKAALSAPIASFAVYAQTLERLVKSTINWDKKPLDVFLQWQYKPSGENTKTFLEIPSNVKHGKFIVPTVEGSFKRDSTVDSVKFVNDAGEFHPFKRSDWFAKSAFATQVNLESTSTTEGAAMNAASGGQVW